VGAKGIERKIGCIMQPPLLFIGGFFVFEFVF